MEIRVASLVREGKSNKEIAEHLSLSKNTILFHRFNLRHKLGIKKQENKPQIPPAVFPLIVIFYHCQLTTFFS